MCAECPLTVPVMSDAPSGAASDIAALTSLMVRGDESAYRLFYDCYYPRLLRYLVVSTGGQDDAAREALQLTMLRVVRYVRAFDSESVLWSWLTVLARSSLLDERRKRKRYWAFLDRFFWHEQRNTGPAGARESDARLLGLLDENLALLAPDERDLIDRKYFTGQSVKEIAETSQATEKAIESRLVRVRRKLRESILSQLNDEKTISS